MNPKAIPINFFLLLFSSLLLFRLAARPGLVERAAEAVTQSQLNIPQLLFPSPSATPSATPGPTATPSATATGSATPVATPPAQISTPSAAVTVIATPAADISQNLQQQVNTLPDTPAKSVAQAALNLVRPPLLLLSLLNPGPYYQSARLPLPATIILLAISAGLVSAGLFLLRL